MLMVVLEGKKRSRKAPKLCRWRGQSATIDNWVVPMRGEAAGEQQVVGMVWSVFESCGAEEKVCHGARCLLECEQHNSKRTATLIFSLNFF